MLKYFTKQEQKKTITQYQINYFSYLLDFCNNNRTQIMVEQQNLNQFNRYLQNNSELIQEKHKEYFGKIYALTLKTVPVHTLIDFIYDIFCISKYKNQPKTSQKISDSLTKNIHDFIVQVGIRGNQPFDAKLAVETMTYCIQNNDIFSVQYDINPTKNTTNQENYHDKTLNIEIKNDYAPQQNQEQADPQKQAQSIRSRIKGMESNHSEQEDNEFNSGGLERLRFKNNMDLIKKNSKIAFLNFCKAQMEIGGRKTFDQLEEEASTMTIGKLLVYAKTYDMLNPQITKHMLMRKFKILSAGKRAIDFQKFFILLTDLINIDENIIDRLELTNQNLYKKVKDASYPFHTQDQNPRELVANRGFTHKITSHSGKTSAELRQDLAERKLTKQPLRNLRSLPKYIFKQDVKIKAKQKMLSPKDLSNGIKAKDYSIQLSFIDKIVSPEDNDQKYLGDYQIQHYNRRGDETAISSNMLNRKHSIVQNIRKRIQQIQHHQSTRLASKVQRKRYNMH